MAIVAVNMVTVTIGVTPALATTGITAAQTPVATVTGIAIIGAALDPLGKNVLVVGLKQVTANNAYQLIFVVCTEM